MSDVYDDSDPFGDGLAGGGAQIPAPGVNPMFDGQVLQQFSGYLLKKSPNRVRLNRWQKRWFVMDGETLTGRVNRVTKRATVLARCDPGHPEAREFSDGGFYRKFFIPVADCRVVEGD